MKSEPDHSLRNTLWSEMGLLVSLVTCALFLTVGKAWLTSLTTTSWNLLMFLSLFGVMLWADFGVVRHADCLAIKLGEPYGTLILTLSVITIEVVMVSAVMLAGANNPTLGRDMMFSVIMIVLNGMVGLSLLLGGWRHVEQQFNLQGANTFLAVILPLSIIGLVLPNYTESTQGGSLSLPLEIFLIVMSSGLYAVFLGIQTLRHREYFVSPQQQKTPLHNELETDHHGFETHSVWFHTLILIVYIVPIVFLSKKLGIILNWGIESSGAPVALGGFLVAILVLSPEALTAFRAALKNQLQRSINVCLGSAVATIGLTIPAILGIGLCLNQDVILGLAGVEMVMLILTLLLCMINFNNSRTNVLQGIVHLLLFGAYVMLIFD